jgi:hypothetical protein
LAPGAAAIASGGAAAPLAVALFARSAQKEEGMLSTTVPASGDRGMRKARIPLDSFAGKRRAREWSAVSKLSFRWALGAGAAWRFATLRIEN